MRTAEKSDGKLTLVTTAPSPKLTKAPLSSRHQLSVVGPSYSS